jgi:DNA-binding transcriptional regulator YdaS (Cro superfamily)
MSALHREALKRAAELLGGKEALAKELKVTPSHLEACMTGVVAVPGDLFLRAAEVIAEAELRQLHSAR